MQQSIIFFKSSLAVGIGYILVLFIAGRIAPVSVAVDAHGGESIIWIPFLSGILIGLTLSAVASQMTASRLRHFFIWSCVVFFNLLSVILEGVFFGDARVNMLEGYASTNYDGTAIGFSEKPMGDQKGYVIAGALWRERDGLWNNAPDYESPTCLKPLTDNQKVRLGVVKVAPMQETPGRAIVVWLECLD